MIGQTYWLILSFIINFLRPSFLVISGFMLCYLVAVYLALMDSRSPVCLVIIGYAYYCNNEREGELRISSMNAKVRQKPSDGIL